MFSVRYFLLILYLPLQFGNGQRPSREVCDLPIIVGTGVYRIPRWGFNQLTANCELFYYSGCCGNANNFDSLQDCKDVCETAVNPCRLPTPNPIPCSASIPGTCPRNQYCHVGADRESTVCCTGDLGNRCGLPLVEGEGTSSLTRFYYDSSNSRCITFQYRGLRGNTNNFMTRQTCEEACATTNPCAIGQPYVDGSGDVVRCSPLSSSSNCPNSYWCHVGATSETTVCCSGASSDRCILSMSTGSGDNSLPRWYYNTRTNVCSQFMYQGLQGNENNFLSQQDCRKTCDIREVDNPCVGQYAMDTRGRPIFCSLSNKENCPVNFWCHIGATPETTMCCPGPTNPCSVPLSPGTGNSNLDRWYYNADRRQCISFIYNGMRGNQNNFVSLSDCEHDCPAELCALSIDRGACNNQQSRYAFNRQEGRCVQFSYNGCGGNLNNFESMADCSTTCVNASFRRRRKPTDV